MAQLPTRQISLLAIALAVAIMLAATAGIAAAEASDSVFASEVDKEFTIWCKQYAYDPAVIEVQQGDRVRLNIKSVDVEHGYYIDGYAVNVKVNPEAPKSVVFVADKVGTFKVRCSVACGPFHPFMAGKLVVRGSPDLLPWALVIGTAFLSVVSLGLPAYILWHRNKADGNN